MRSQNGCRLLIVAKNLPALIAKTPFQRGKFPALYQGWRGDELQLAALLVPYFGRDATPASSASLV